MHQDGRLILTAFDMSGQSKYRSMWERYYAECHGVIFVIDSSDTMRLAVAANELQLMLQHPDVSKRQAANDSCRVPILVLANKSDLDSAIPIGQVKREKNENTTGGVRSCAGANMAPALESPSPPSSSCVRSRPTLGRCAEKPAHAIRFLSGVRCRVAIIISPGRAGGPDRAPIPRNSIAS